MQLLPILVDNGSVSVDDCKPIEPIAYRSTSATGKTQKPGLHAQVLPHDKPIRGTGRMRGPRGYR